jgi:glycine/sarcosine N-methyltransferase
MKPFRGDRAGTHRQPHQAMEPDPRNFYDALANDYHLIFDDWDASIGRQSAVIHSLLGEQPQRVLDMACGMGTQAIGLARLGHAVVARDLSPALVERARVEARRLGTALDISVRDMRVAVAADRSLFDAVIAFDNAFPHLETDADLVAALAAAHHALRPGGRLLASIRDYDDLVQKKPSYDPPRRLGSGHDERVVFQLWDWDKDGRGYCFEHIILVRDGPAAWQTRTTRGHYRALLRLELSEAAVSVGFSDPHWNESKVSGFYQPIFIATKSEVES